MSKYINKLTDEEIERFLNDNGYKLVKDLHDSKGDPINAIERYDDNIFVRAQQIISDEIIETEKLLLQKMSNLIAYSGLISMFSSYSENIDLIHISDYYISKLCILEEDKKSSEELCISYFKYMKEKFPTYKNDLLEYYKSLPDDELCDEKTM